MYSTDARHALVGRAVVVFEYLDGEGRRRAFRQLTNSYRGEVTLRNLNRFVEYGGIGVASRRYLYLVRVGREFEVFADRPELHAFENCVTVYIDVNVGRVGRGMHDAQFPICLRLSVVHVRRSRGCSG